MYLLDTDILIDVQRGYAPALEWFAGLSFVPAIPGYVAMELLQDAKNRHQVRQVVELVNPLPIIWPSPQACDTALVYFREYHLSHGLGLLDTLIAACALERELALCTFNVRHFRSVPGLSLEQPYGRQMV
jgi:predicted nucleic acid-binding protein